MMNLRSLACVALALLASGGALFAAACNSSPAASGCNESPWQCASGNTCWPTCGCPSGQACTVNNCTVQYSCLASSRSAVVGTTCDLRSGVAECNDYQTCVSFPDGGGGSCQTFCSQDGQCPQGLVCETLSVEGASGRERVCVPPGLYFDAAGLGTPDTGMGSGSGTTTDSGSDLEGGAMFDGQQMKQ